MATKVFGFRYSTNTQRVQLLLMGLGIDFDFVDINLKEGEQRVRITQHFLPGGQKKPLVLNGCKN